MGRVGGFWQGPHLNPRMLKMYGFLRGCWMLPWWDRGGDWLLGGGMDSFIDLQRACSRDQAVTIVMITVTILVFQILVQKHGDDNDYSS